mgnify:CR=1 FL=1
MAAWIDWGFMTKQFETEVFESSFQHVKYALVCSKKEHKSFIRGFLGGEFKGRSEFIEDGAGAMIDIMPRKSGKVTLALVSINKREWLTADIEQVYGMLAHEAVHIFQEVKSIMGEKEPSIEFEAYSVGQIAQNLFYAYKVAV